MISSPAGRLRASSVVSSRLVSAGHGKLPSCLASGVCMAMHKVGGSGLTAAPRDRPCTVVAGPHEFLACDRWCRLGGLEDRAPLDAWNGTSLARWKLNNPARAARSRRPRNNRRLPFRVIHLGSFPRDDDERHVREDPLARPVLSACDTGGPFFPGCYLLLSSVAGPPLHVVTCMRVRSLK